MIKFRTKIQEKLKANYGFSFIELIVVVAIFLLITSIVLFRQTKFSSDILISNMAYEVALSIREAQVLGISSRQNAGDFKVGYGIYINGKIDGVKPDNYIFFVDTKSGTDISTGEASFNYSYQESLDPILDQANLTRGQKIKDFCGHTVVNGWECWNATGGYTNFALNIVFVKPDPDANIKGGWGSELKVYDEAVVVIESSLGDKCRTVRVSASGQISVDPISQSDPAGCDSTTWLSSSLSN